jgi:hypothetical protein
MVWRIYGWLRVLAWFIVTKRRVAAVRCGAAGGGWRWCMEWVAGYAGYHENGMYYKFSSSGGTEILGIMTFQPKIFRLKFEYFFFRVNRPMAKIDEG